MNDLHARVGRRTPTVRGIEVHEVEQIDAAPAPRDYPDPLSRIAGGNAGTEHDAEPDDDLACMRGVLYALAVSACIAAAALVAVALLAPTARAGELHVVAHGASVHFGRIDPAHAQRAVMCDAPASCAAARYEAINPGLALRWQHTNSLAVQAGAYRNSYARYSRYALLDWTPLRLSARATVGLFAGVTDNYPLRDFAPIPAAGAVLRWQDQRLGVALRLLPPVGGKTNGGLSAEIGWRL